MPSVHTSRRRPRQAPKRIRSVPMPPADPLALGVAFVMRRTGYGPALAGVVAELAGLSPEGRRA